MVGVTNARGVHREEEETRVNPRVGEFGGFQPREPARGREGPTYWEVMRHTKNMGLESFKGTKDPTIADNWRRQLERNLDNMRRFMYGMLVEIHNRLFNKDFFNMEELVQKRHTGGWDSHQGHLSTLIAIAIILEIASRALRVDDSKILPTSVVPSLGTPRRINSLRLQRQSPEYVIIVEGLDTSRESVLRG
ncbi:unnamed protein product [Cochlearia groenlandica]